MILDLHCHTRYSFDSRSSPAAVLRAARRRGLDAIAITDHDTIEGALEARDLANGSVAVIIGEEITTDAGDIIGLFLREPVRAGSALEVIEQIHAQDGLAVLPHPFGKTMAVPEEVLRRLDACEGFNARYATIARVADGEGDPRAMRLAAEYGLAVVASSDAHVPADVGRARTIVSAHTLEEARAEIRAGRTRIEGARIGPATRAWRRVLEVAAEIIHPIPEAAVWPQASETTRENS
jgi:predicted metal-dependent phosphoesterase TrpH